MITKTDLETQIVDSYTKLGYKPQGNQLEIVYLVTNAYLNKGKKNVVLSAPVGIGKSIVGAVIADVVSVFTPECENLTSIIAMGTNGLAHQYFDSFSKHEKYQFFQIKGASNYPCAFLESQLSADSKTADECAMKILSAQEVDKYCRKCEYRGTKALINTTQNLITNYSYFLISAMASDHLKPRKMHIFDEAHTLNEIFCSYTEIVVSVEQIDRHLKELSNTNGKCDNEMAGLVMLKNLVSTGGVGDNNYNQVLDILLKIYGSIESVLSNQATGLVTEDKVKSIKYSKMARKYASLGSKIADLFDNEYDHVFDNSVPNTFTVKTIFVGKMMDRLLTDYNLLMSATITEQFAFDTLSLDRDQTEFIQLAPVFPAENKPLFFLGKQTLNYNTMKLDSTINDLKAQVKAIVEFHGDDKGLVLVPSFYLGSQLARAVGRDTRVFEHKSGVNISAMISDFKSYKGSAILVSPSIFEGLDFKDDHSRYQIICKSPYPSLGDKRIKYIADNYPNIYQEMTLIKILQGIGRSVRNYEDYAATYFLDASSKKLYDSKLNIWKDQYDVKTK